jgi:hypothetical protein
MESSNEHCRAIGTSKVFPSRQQGTVLLRCSVYRHLAAVPSSYQTLTVARSSTMLTDSTVLIDMSILPPHRWRRAAPCDEFDTCNQET